MNNLNSVHACTRRFTPKPFVFVSFFICLLVAGLNWGSAQSIVSYIPGSGNTITPTEATRSHSVLVVLDQVTTYSPASSIEEITLRSNTFPTFDVAQDQYNISVESSAGDNNPSSSFVITVEYPERQPGIGKDLELKIPVAAFRTSISSGLNIYEYRIDPFYDWQPIILSTFIPTNPIERQATATAMTVSWDEPISFTQISNNSRPVTIREYDTDNIILTSGTGFTVIDNSPPSTQSAIGDITTLTVMVPTNALNANTRYYLDFSQITEFQGNNLPSRKDQTDFFIAAEPNQAPTDIVLSANSIQENNSIDEFIGTFSTTDPNVDDTHTYSLVSGTGSTDNTSFDIDGNDLITAAIFDFETKTSYSIRVQTDDGDGGTFQKVFTINVTNDPVDDSPAPVVISRTPADGSVITDVNTNFTITFDKAIEFGLGGNVSGPFIRLYRGGNAFAEEGLPVNDPNVSISGSSLTVDFTPTLVEGESYNIRIQNGYLRAAGGGQFVSGLDNSTEWNFTVTANNSPTDITLLAGNSFDENLDPTEGLTELETTDPDAGDSHTYTLVAGTGDMDNSAFEIVDDMLRSLAPFDFETKNTYSIRIQTEDEAGATFAKVFVINVNDIADETPPVVTTTVPADGAFNVSLTANFSLTFDENVSFENDENTIQLWNATSSTLVESMGFSQISPSFGTTISINPTADLLPNTDYYVIISGEGTFTDGSDNAFTGFEDPTDWNFSTSAPADITPPAFSSTAPLDDAVYVPLVPTLLFTFNEDIVIANFADIKLRRSSDDVPEPVLTSILNGNQLRIIRNGGQLQSNTAYHVTILPGAIEDLSGNAFSGWADNDKTSFNFTTLLVDNTPPNYFSAQTVPLDNATDVAIDIEVKMTFDEDIVIANTSGIELVKLAGFESIPVTNSVSGSELTISPTSNLENATDYFISISNAAIEDQSGNAFGGISNRNSFNFTTINETIAPTLVSTDPTDDAVEVSTQPTILLTFSEDITLVQMTSVKLRKVSDNGEQPILRTIVNGNQLRIQRNGGQLEQSTAYYVTVLDDAIEDLAGNPFAGWADDDQTTYNFTTVSPVDNTPPVVSTTVPATGANNVPIDLSQFQVTFNEPIQFISNTLSSVRLQNSSNTAEVFVFPTSNMAINGSTLTVDLSNVLTSDLIASNPYRFSMDAGLIEDIAGNDFSGMFGSDRIFITTAAAVNNPPTNITLLDGDTFDENQRDPSEGLTGLGTTDPDVGDSHTYSLVAGTGDTDNVSFEIVSDILRSLAPFDFETKNTYSIRIQTEDQAGATFSKAFTINVNDIADETPPVVTTTVPTDGAFNVSLTDNFSLTFDENVGFENDENTIKLWNATTGTLVESMSFSQISPSFGTTISINPTADLLPNTDYYIIISSEGTFADGSDNAFAGFEDPADWNFSTSAPPDVTAPSSISFAPTDDAINVSTSPTLEITFDEPVRLSGTLAVRLFTVGLMVQQFASNSPFLVVNNATLSISPSVVLQEGTVYHIEMEPGFIEDLAGNAYAGFEDNTTWNFTVGKRNQTITFNNISNRTFSPVAFQLSASASSGLPIEYTVTSGNATVSGDQLTLTGVGSVTVRADQAGNTEYGAATPKFQTFDVSKAVQTITFEPLVTRDINAAPFDLEATASSGLDVVYESSNNSVATISGKTVNIQGVGSTTITASQPGNDNYLSAQNRTQTLTITSTDITPPTVVQFTPANASTGVDININELVLELSETVTAGTFGAFNLRGGVGADNLIKQWNFNTGTDITVSGTTVTLANVPTLERAGLYYIQFSPGNMVNPALSDAAGNMMQGWNTAGVWTFRTERLDQTITFDALADKTFGDAPFTLSATATSNLDVAFSVESGPASLLGDELTITCAGVVTIAANQAGDAEYNAAPEVTQSFTVSKANQTITFTPIADKTFGDTPFTLSATATSTLSVAFSVQSGPASIDGNEVTITGAGEVTIAANQAGDAAYNPAPEVTQSFTVAKADQVITLEQIDDQDISNSPVAIVASTTSGLSLVIDVDGPATLNGTSLTLDDVGTVTVTVSQAGNDNFNAALSVSTSFVVTDASRTDQTITFPEITAKTFGQDAFALNAIASSNLDVAYTVVSGPITITGNSVRITGAGTATIAANQSGNTSFNPAPEVRKSFAIAKAGQAITFNAIPNQVFGDEDFNFIATTSAGLTVSFSVITGPASVNGNTVSLTGAGTVEIAADQAGNDKYNAATRVTRSFEVAKADQVVTIESITEKTTLSDPFDLVASVDTDLPLTYTVTGPATIDGEIITLTGTAGEVTVTATQVGDDNYNTASANTTFTVVQGLLPQTISFSEIEDQVYGATISLDASAESNLEIVYELLTDNLVLEGTTLTFSGVGFAAIKAVQVGNGEYQAAEVVREFIIERAALSLVADDLSREYGQDNPELTFSADGLVYGETVAEALSELPAVMTPASEVSIPGTYVISLTGGVADNYVLSQANGSLEITKATLTVTAADAERAVGEATDPFVLSYDGFVDGQDETSLGALPTAISTATFASGIGAYPITPQGGSSPIYSFDYVEGTLTIIGGTVSEQVDPATPLGQGTAVLHQQNLDGNFVEVGQAILNADGSFAFGNVDAGAHTISIVPSGSDLDLYFTTFLGGANLFNNAGSFDLTVGVSDLTITMLAKPIAQGNGGDNTVNGTLTNDPNATGGRLSQSAAFEGDPISDTEIWLVDANGNIVGFDITDANGNYSFTGLTVGSYTLQLNHEGELLDFSGATVTIEEGQETVNISTAINASGEVLTAPAVITSLDQLPQIEWAVYPNPTRDLLQISIDQQESWLLRIVNMNGQLMLQHDFSTQTSLRLGHLPKGIYLLQLSDESRGQQLQRRIRLE